MDGAANKAEELRRQISQAEKQLEDLRRQLQDLEASGDEYVVDQQEPHDPPPLSNGAESTTKITQSSPPPATWNWPLEQEEYTRYARQLILPSVGIAGQLRLKSARVLVVGAGGLGCPAASYLAGAGVGVLGIADGDVVEASNLHRQVGHATARVGQRKVDSLVAHCRALNPRVRYTAHAMHLTPRNAAEIVGGYDVVLDCTDNPATRYLVSDVCVLLGRPLVSASALRTDGQLIVLNYPPAPPRGAGGEDGRGGVSTGEAGPCYRCVFPRPPPAEGVVSCGEGGILGPVVGVMGVLQALEAIKIITAPPRPGPTTMTANGGGEAGTAEKKQSSASAPSLLLFSAYSTPSFRSVRMRGRRPDCVACSPGSTLTLEELSSGSLDYVRFCGVNTPVDVLRPEERVSAAEYYGRVLRAERPGAPSGGRGHLLLDVREREHYDIASIPGSVNVPFSRFRAQDRSGSGGDDGRGEQPKRPDWIPESLPPDAPIYVVCRVGNDSQLVTRRLKEMALDGGGARFIGDIKGGMRAWKQEVDPTIPFT
ncbi:hypothetical protein DL769_008148 [Monosporascus sp. CRB-8-3]|nr:hypothetical protein DL769_008148 [Monosporascus sp. CRB-8-3]